MIDKKNIAVFSLAYEPMIGGAEIALKEIISRIPDYHYFIYTNKFSAKDKELETIDNITIVRLGLKTKFTFLNKYFFPFFAYQRFAKDNHEKKFVLQWAMMATYAGIASLLVKYKFPQIPYLLTDQSGDSDWFLFKRTWWWRCFYKQIYQKADRVQVISRWLEKRVRKYGYKKQIDLIPNGVDIKNFSNINLNDKDKQELKTSYGFALDDRIIISPSRLVTKNGLYYLIAAAAHLPGKYKIVIVGDGKLQYKLRQQALGLGISDRVIFLNSINHQELARFLAISFAMCRPSLSEGFGNVFVEAMASGVPVVGTEVGGIPDIITNGVNGLLVANHNPLQLAKTIVSLEDVNLRQQLIENGLKSAQNYSWGDISKKMNDLIKQLIN